LVNRPLDTYLYAKMKYSIIGNKEMFFNGILADIGMQDLIVD
jgi:hypothetical protein